MKSAGGARTVVFEPAMRDRAARRGVMAAELRQALANGELFFSRHRVDEREARYAADAWRRDTERGGFAALDE